MYLTTKGLVLRQTQYQDADLILTVLTCDQGLLTLRAHGVRGKSSRLKAPCQLLAYSEFTIFQDRGFSAVREAETIEMFPELRNDLELLSLGSYFAQAAEVLSQEDLPNPGILSLTLNALYALCKLKKPQALVKAAFELRLACLAGYEPDLTGCAVCGKEEPNRFSVTGGVLLCSGCPDEEKNGLRLPIGRDSLAAMRYIVACPKEKLFSFAILGQAEKELADAAETYFVTQLERGFYTLDFYKSLKIG
jgi:DNA repair protein RecO (recombination protein O)